MKKIQKNKSTKKGTQKKGYDFKLYTEILGLCMIGVAVLVIASLFSNKVGIVGEGIQFVFLGFFGIGGYIMPFYGMYVGILYIKKDIERIYGSLMYSFSFILIMMSFFSLISYGNRLEEPLLSFYYINEGAWSNGGFLGAVFAVSLIKLFGIYGSFILLGIIFSIWLLIVTRFPILSWTQEWLQSKSKKIQSDRKAKQKLKKAIQKTEKPKTDKQDDAFLHMPIKINPPEEPIVEMFAEEVKQMPMTVKPKVDVEVLQETWKEIEASEGSIEPYTYPTIELLNEKELKGQSRNSSRNALTQAKKLEETLLSFGVEAKVTQINQGPTVTRYELQPRQGVKVSKIVNLSDDIALNLAAAGIRIEAPIPGKAAVGIEIPNENSEMVYLREVIDTDQFKAFPSKLAFALGRDIGGKPIVTDIGKMPHILIAGATGSGKSVCINTLITSILYKATPSEVKLIMIDPKVVELNVYNGIPHLMIPVVTDPKKAAGALSWAVNEMTKRYQLFAENHVRDMKGFNAKQTDDTQKMPHIIIIIDELADLMMTAAKEVEDAICRLAQMARAAGIHLVIATQRPSVDVITGVIKANIPSRLAFAVSSGIDSRTILDMNGAEKLLGKGDMLFYPVGESKPIRIQGAFISDKEVEHIVEAVKASGEVKYEEMLIDSITTASVPIESSTEDEFLQEAMTLVQGKEKVSISMLQRYFRIGFNRASRLMDELHARGVVGPDEGSKPRKVIQQNINLEE